MNQHAAFAKTPEFWRRMGWGIAIALLSAIGTLLFVILMNAGLSWVWKSWLDPEQMSALYLDWRIVAITTVAGLTVGLLIQYTNAEEIDVLESVQNGYLKSKQVPASLLVSMVSLVGGFSVGPEVPSGMLGGGLGTWFSERFNLSDEDRESNVLSGVVSAYGGLFTSPLAFVLMRLELPHVQTPAYFAVIAIATAAAYVGFSVFYVMAGNEFAELLRLLELPTYTLEIWHLFVALALSLLGVVLTLVYGIMLGTLRHLATRLESRPILRCTGAGFLLGLLGMALPLTMFLGSESLVFVTENGAELGLALIVLLVFGKILATAGAISMGFIGGPIFPLLFVGGAAGVAVNLVFPEIPLAVAVGCTMAALTAAALPAPIMIIVVVLLVTGVPATEGLPIILAGLAAHMITFGFGFLPRVPAPAHVKVTTLSPGVPDDFEDDQQTSSEDG